MGLYPDLLPTDYRKQLQYPNPLPVLSGAELEKAHLALIDYLTQVGRYNTEVYEACNWKFQNLFLYGRELRAYDNEIDIPLVNAGDVFLLLLPT
jgi:hypothetical protein